MPVPEAQIEEGRPSGPGWFVLNLSESAAGRRERSGTWSEFEPPPDGFPEYGVNVHVVMPGQANCLYHAESNQEDFLVLHGECIAILMIGARNPDDRIEYPVSEVAARHNASAAETTNSGREAYRDFPPESHDERFTWPLMERGPEARG